MAAISVGQVNGTDLMLETPYGHDRASCRLCSITEPKEASGRISIGEPEADEALVIKA